MGARDNQTIEHKMVISKRFSRTIKAQHMHQCFEQYEHILIHFNIDIVRTNI